MLIHPNNLRDLLHNMVISNVAKECGIDYAILRRFSLQSRGRPSSDMIDKLRVYFNKRAALYSHVSRTPDYFEQSPVQVPEVPEPEPEVPELEDTPDWMKS